MIKRKIPIAERRSANGSLEPVGACPIPKIPTSVSKRSARAMVVPVLVLGKTSPANFGKYCSPKASKLQCFRLQYARSKYPQYLEVLGIHQQAQRLSRI